jgi:hypothetical protein
MNQILAKKETKRRKTLDKLIRKLEALEQLEIQWPEPLPKELMDEYPE